MSNILQFKKPKAKKKKGDTLCKQGHHKWEIFQDKQFDSKEGKLVTIFQCSRCSKQKTKLL